MNVADNLLRDHEEIAAMLHVVSACAARLQQDQYVDPGMLQGLDRFLQQLVGDCYFSKQRTVLLPHVRAVVPEEAAGTHQIAALRAAALAPMREFHGVVERALAAGIEPLVAEFGSVSSTCVERLRAVLAAERPLLDRLRRLPQGDQRALLDTCAALERGSLGATGREWYTQLVADYSDIARTWTSWPATAGAPAIGSGRASAEAGSNDDRR